MQKWEYLTFYDSGEGWQRNGEQIKILRKKNFGTPNFFEYLNYLGDEGWELVSVIWECSKYTFKRHKTYSWFYSVNRNSTLKED